MHQDEHRGQQNYVQAEWNQVTGYIEEDSYGNSSQWG